jgi:glutamate-1-semialdehyde aminotransferase
VLRFLDGGRDWLLGKSLFQQEALRRGVLFTGGHNLCYAHSEADVDRTLAVYDEAMAILARAIADRAVAARLEGKPVQPVFRVP